MSDLNERLSYLVTAKFEVTKDGVVVDMERGFFNKYLFFTSLQAETESFVEKAILRSLRSFVSMRLGSGYKVKITSKIKVVRQDRGTPKKTRQLEMFV